MDLAINIFVWIIKNILIINIFLAMLLVFFERRNPTSTWLWLMVLTFLPGLGFILYLFIGQDLSKKKMFRTKEEEDYCFRDLAQIQENLLNEDRLEYAMENYEGYEDLIRMNLISADAFLTQDNHIDIFYEGNDKFNELINSIRYAENYIHLQYYIFKSDGLGKEIINELINKGKEGLEVKVLFDGMGGRKFSRKYVEDLREAGVEVEVFFPFIVPFISPRINYRNHRKICIIDGKEAYIGGFNIGDEYIGKSKRFGFWRDTHLRIRGSAITSLEWRFLLDFRFASKKDIKHCQTYIVDKSNEGTSGVQIVSSGPDSKWPSIKDAYLKMISNANERLYIQSPYFIPDDAIFEALRLAGLSGRDVRVMIPSKAGVRFYTYEKGFLHSKVFLMDDFVSSVGTANLDIRSFNLNFEVNAFVYDKSINEDLYKQFLEDLKDCKEITLEEYDRRGRIVKIKESFSRLLSPIL